MRPCEATALLTYTLCHPHCESLRLIFPHSKRSSSVQAFKCESYIFTPYLSYQLSITNQTSFWLSFTLKPKSSTGTETLIAQLLRIVWLTNVNLILCNGTRGKELFSASTDFICNISPLAFLTLFTHLCTCNRIFSQHLYMSKWSSLMLTMWRRWHSQSGRSNPPPLFFFLRHVQKNKNINHGPSHAA